MASEVIRNPRADALLLTIALILLAWSAVVFILRLLLRLKILRATQWNTSQVLGGDDLFCALGTVLAAAQTIVFCIAIRDRDGPLTREGRAANPQYYPLHFSATLLWLASVACGKGSVIMILRRIKPEKVYRMSCLAILVGCMIWLAVSLVLAGLDCDGVDGWRVARNTCPSMNIRRLVVGALDAALEVVLFGMAIWLVWDIQAPWSRKMQFILACSFRLLVIIATIARLFLSSSSRRRSGAFIPDPDTFMCSQAEVHYGIMAVTIPMLKPIVLGLNTSCGMYGGLELEQNAGSSYNRQAASDRRSAELKMQPHQAVQAVDSNTGKARVEEDISPDASPSSSTRRRPSQSACSDGSEAVMIRL